MCIQFVYDGFLADKTYTHAYIQRSLIKIELIEKYLAQTYVNKISKLSFKSEQALCFDSEALTSAASARRSIPILY